MQEHNSWQGYYLQVLSVACLSSLTKLAVMPGITSENLGTPYVECELSVLGSWPEATAYQQ